MSSRDTTPISHPFGENKNYYVKVRQVLAEEFFDFVLINTSQSSSTQKKMFFPCYFLRENL